MKLIVIAMSIALAGTAPLSLAHAQPATSPSPASAYNVDTTDIGTLLDDAAAKAVVDKHLPGFSANAQIDMARGMTLKAVQQYAPDMVTDKALAAIQLDLAKLPTPK